MHHTNAYVNRQAGLGMPLLRLGSLTVRTCAPVQDLVGPIVSSSLDWSDANPIASGHLAGRLNPVRSFPFSLRTHGTLTAVPRCALARVTFAPSGVTRCNSEVGNG